MQSDLLTKTLYQISSAVNSTGDLNHLYEKIHQSLSNIINVKNFYIALYEPQEGAIHFPYFIDEQSKLTSGFKYTVLERPSSLTSLVIRLGKPALFSEQDIIDFYLSLNVEPSGPVSKVWIGVPLKIDDVVIGVVAAQSYTDPNCYNKNDLEVLISISDQIAIAIDRKKSQKRFQNLVENITDIIYTTNSTGKITYISPAITTVTGYTASELIGTYRWDSKNANQPQFNRYIHPDDQPIVEATIKNAARNLSPFETEYRIIKKDGTAFWNLDRGQFFKDDMNNAYLEGVITNIQERKRAEDINKVLYYISNAVNTTRNLDELYTIIYESLMLIVNVDRFAIVMYDKDQDSITATYSTKSEGIDFPKVIKNASKSTSLSAEVITTAKPIIFDKKGMIQFAREKGGEVLGTPTESWLGVPLSVKGEIIGVMLTETLDVSKAYTQEDVDYFVSVSDQIAIAIERKTNEEQIRMREKIITSLYKISNAQHSTKNLQQLYQSIRNALSNIIDVRNFTISLYDKKKDTLQFQFCSDNEDENSFSPMENASSSNSLTYKVINDEKSLLIRNVDKQTPKNYVWRLKPGVSHPKCWLGVPLKGKDQVLGALIIQSYSDPFCYDEQDVALLESVSEQIAIAIAYKNAEANLESAQLELLEKAHKAGMADIASDTIHNLGNILNSAKIANESISNDLNNSHFEKFSQAISLLSEKIDQLPDFICNDPKGKMLMQYLISVEGSLSSEIANISKSSKRLTEKIELMTSVIRNQQNYIYEEFMEEDCFIIDIVDKMLDMHFETFKNMGVKIIKNYVDVPKVQVQKTKLEFIIMNILHNARDAMKTSVINNKTLYVTIDQDQNHIYLRFKDDGEGITPENLSRIFTHGFTTKARGHGFGLHNAANFLSDMKGKIWAESDGPGKGSTFVLGFQKK